MNKYDYINSVKSPKVIFEGWKLRGTQEIVGKQHNPTILNWAKELGLEKKYTADEIAWCGLYVAYVIKQAGFEPVKDPLWARNWGKFGTSQKEAMLGDVLVFTRPNGGGHVGFYVGEDDTCYHVLGGNQNNRVNVTRILKNRCISIRRCAWRVSQPPAVKKYFVTAQGEISTNEA